jgi:hypothetical protein
MKTTANSVATNHHPTVLLLLFDSFILQYTKINIKIIDILYYMSKFHTIKIIIWYFGIKEKNLTKQ